MSKIMKIRFLAIILISFLGIFNFLFKNSASAETISVCSSGCNYSTIEEAVNQAKTGDLILVEDGSYNESVTIDKPLIIKSKNGPEKCTVYHLGFPFIISTSSVQIEGFTLIGTSMWGYWGPTGGVFLNGNNNTILNNVFLNSDYGLYLKDANQNIIKNNTFKNINHGIYFFSSSSENEISDNYLETNTSGIKLYGNNNKIEGNTILAKGKYGIWILNSRNNYLSNNSLMNSGIYVGGGAIADYFQEIDGTNRVNGKPLYYCKNKENETVPETGQAILVNCKNIFIENQQMSNLPAAIEIVSSSDIMINNSVLSNNDYGIFVFSSKNIVIENSFFQNNWQSVVLENSNNNTIKNNNFSSNDYPLTLRGSNWNIIQNNIFKNNFYALIISGSESNKIDYNQFMSNNLAIFLKSGSKRNEIIHNNLKENQNTLYLYDLPPKENSIYLNNFIKNARDLSISSYGTVFWNSKEKINYTFKGLSFSNYLGNYWDKYKSQDENKDGIGDATFEIAPLWGAYKDEYPLIEPFENYFPAQKWKFENEFLLDLDGNSKTVEGKGYTLGNVYLSEIEPNFDALKIEGRISLDGNLPSQIPKIYLIATDGMDKEIASTTIPFNLISYSQIEKKVYSFSLSLLNPPKPINGGHYEVYLELGNNPLLINTTSKISKYYFPLIYFPEKKVLIYEVYYNVATGTDPDNEWIILHNLEDESVDISGWEIVDNYATDTIPQFSIIPANGFAIITASSTTFNLWKIPKGMTKIVLGDKRIGNALANSGDRVILKDRYGNIVDAMSYGNDKSIFDNPPKAKKGYSLLRDPPEKDTNTAEDFKESEPTIEKNQPPIPIINFSPKNPVKGIEVKFDASSSTDPDGEIVNFEWQIASTTLSGTTTEFVFEENGEYQIILTAIDNDSATSSTSTTIKVEPFFFAIITDLHIGWGIPDYNGEGFEEYPFPSHDAQDYYISKRLEMAVDWINNHYKENNIKFVVVLGDISDTAEYSEFLKAREILNKLEIPYVPILGNHDIWPYTQKITADPDNRLFSIKEKSSGSLLGDAYFDIVFWGSENSTNTQRIKDLFDYFERQEDLPEYQGPPYFTNYAFGYGGINFITLDFASRDSFLILYSPINGVEHKETLDWLKEHLKKCTQNSGLIFTHYPFLEFVGGFLSMEKIKQQLLDSKCKIINFGGHTHMNKVSLFENVHQTIETEALSQIPLSNILRGKYIVSGKFIRVVTVDGKNPDEIFFEDLIDNFPKAINPYITANKEEVGINEKVVFFAHSKNIKPEEIFTYEWDFDQNSFGTCEGERKEKCRVVYTQPGIYRVKLKAIPIWDKTYFEEVYIYFRVNDKPRMGFNIFLPTPYLTPLLNGENINLSEKENAQSFNNWVWITKTIPTSNPIGAIKVNFESASEDVNLSGLVADTNLQTKKIIFRMERWPSVIEQKKIIFLLKGK